jgi:(2Fe-2S) ferredoxin
VKPHTTHDTVPPPWVIYSGLLEDLLISGAPARRKPAPEAEETISKKGKKAKQRAQKGGPLAMLDKPNAKIRGYDAHVLVCKGGDCKKRGSKTVRSTLKNELRARGMNRDVRIDCVDCLGLCKHGPNLVVYPGGTWYLGVTHRDVPEVVREHLVNGEPVEHLAAELRPRKRAK